MAFRAHADCPVYVALHQMEFDEKELRREISYAIKNIHGIRYVSQTYINLFKRALSKTLAYVIHGASLYVFL